MTASFRIFEPEVVEASRRSPWWWSMADNPPCMPWCDAQHDPHEFLVMGALGCTRAFGAGDDSSRPRGHALVDVTAHREANNETPFLVDDPAFYIAVRGKVEDLTPPRALEVAAALTAAAAFVEQALAGAR